VPLHQRAKHGLLSGLLPLPSAVALSHRARAVAREQRLPNQLVELSELERTVLGKVGPIEPNADFELCADLAFAHEALGNNVQGDHYRELALQLAERQGNFLWASTAVLTPPVNGRTIASGRSPSQISRAINLAGPGASQQTVLQLRAERVHRLALSGSAQRITVEDLASLRSVQPSEVSPDTWMQIVRARLCADLATAKPQARIEAAASLEPARQQSEDHDLRADSLVFLVRHAIETHEPETVDVALQQVEEEFLTSTRPVDRWMRNVIRCTAFALRGELTAAYSYAVEAQRLGALYGISDSAITWQLQSAKLLVYKPNLAALVGVEPLVEITEATDLVVDETMEGNLLALALALLAQGEFEQGNADTAASWLEAAQQLFEPTSCDLYRLVAAAQIVQTCFASGSNPRVDLLEQLRSAETTSPILGMIPGWSMGPALRYAALANHLSGNSVTALEELLTCADVCRDSKQHLWEFTSLDDVLNIEANVGNFSHEQRLAISSRHQNLSNRFT
jgi:hypothetical protein